MFKRRVFAPRFRLRQAGCDDGFTLIEAIVSLSIASFVFMALSFALISGVHVTALSQQNQQAGDVLNQAVEQARALGYDALSMRSSDLNTGEPTRTPTLASCSCFDPDADATSGSGVEPLVTDPAGGVFPHVTTVTQNHGTFTLRRYVTAPTDTAGTYKHLTVVVGWLDRGKPHTRTISTAVAATKRGLPLPDFKLTSVGGQNLCRNPSSAVVYALDLRNNGARDAWAMTVGSAVVPWTFYLDVNLDGDFDVTVDSALASVSGAPSTGPIESNQSVRVFAVAQIPAAGSLPYTWDVAFIATSVAQPQYSQSVPTVTTVQLGPCDNAPVPTPSASASPSANPLPTISASPLPVAPTQPLAPCASLTGLVSASAPGGTVVRYHLENSITAGNTAALQRMPMVRADAGGLPSLSLYTYSSDLTSVAGRYLNGPQGANASPAYLATWQYQMPATSKIKGNGEVTVYVAPASGLLTAAPALRFTVDLLDAGGNYLSTLTTASYSTPITGLGCIGFRPISVALTGLPNNFTVNANQQLRLSVALTNAVPVVLAYGTLLFPSELSLPFTSGQG